jgi:hypothetical protein
MNGNSLMLFGKHRGQPLDVMLRDTSYVSWLLRQPWLREKHPQLDAFIRDQYRLPPGAFTNLTTETLLVSQNMKARQVSCLDCARSFVLAEASVTMWACGELIGHVCLLCMSSATRDALQAYARQILHQPSYELPNVRR